MLVGCGMRKWKIRSDSRIFVASKNGRTGRINILPKMEEAATQQNFWPDNRNYGPVKKAGFVDIKELMTGGCLTVGSRGWRYEHRV